MALLTKKDLKAWQKSKPTEVIAAKQNTNSTDPLYRLVQGELNLPDYESTSTVRWFQIWNPSTQAWEGTPFVPKDELHRLLWMESKKTLPDKTDIKTSLQEQGPTNEVPFEDGPLDTRSVCMSMDNGVRSWYRRVQCATTGRLSTRPKKGNILFQRWIYPEKCWLIVSKESIPAEIVKCLSTVDPVPTYWMEKELKEVAQEKSVIEKAPKDMTGVVCVGSEYVRRIQYRCGSIHYQIWSTDSKTSRWLECSGKKLSAVVRASLKHIEPVMSEQLKIKLTRAKAKLAKAIPSKGNIYRIVAKIGDSAGDYRLIYYPKERVFKTQILGADGRTWLPCGKNKPIAVVKYLNAEKKEYMLALKQ